jgi:urea transport system permease protein
MRRRPAAPASGLYAEPAMPISLVAVVIFVAALFAAPLDSKGADKPDFAAAVGGLSGGFAAAESAIDALAATGDPRAVAVLRALEAGELRLRKTDRAILLVRRNGEQTILIDPVTGQTLGPADESGLERVRVNNRVRRAIEAAMGTLTLLHPDTNIRREAAGAILRSRDPNAVAALDVAIAAERDPGLAILMRQARAASLLAGEAGDAEKLAAIEQLRRRADRVALAVLAGAASRSGSVVNAAAQAATGAIEQELAVWEAAQHVWYGVSLGSVLLLAAIGLAITFGVMGVINMAHGEMVMLGAYTTFAVQSLVRSAWPDLADLSLLLALPLAFFVSGAVGILIERGVIRWLYGRQLETLLATWGLSLVLQQTVRTVFGPTNREVSNPSWMSGAFEVGPIAITYNRLWILMFALLVFALLIVVLHRTSFGLHLRAVTQNRAMAGAMGIRTPLVDALTFGLGSGIAGLAGVALSQIDNVSPNLGQAYIIDSFMVVVFGGVGNLWGSLVGAFTLGIANKFLEPYAGAVLGKIAVLLFIILFIQKRPRGLFAERSRAAEA